MTSDHTGDQLHPIDDDLARTNRQVLAERLGWPDGAVLSSFPRTHPRRACALGAQSNEVESALSRSRDQLGSAEKRDLTWKWLQRIAQELHGGDLGRCLAAVLRQARIADESINHGSVTSGELRPDPRQPLDETLRHRSPGS